MNFIYFFMINLGIDIIVFLYKLKFSIVAYENNSRLIDDIAKIQQGVIIFIQQKNRISYINYVFKISTQILDDQIHQRVMISSQKEVRTTKQEVYGYRKKNKQNSIEFRMTLNSKNLINSIIIYLISMKFSKLFRNSSRNYVNKDQNSSTESSNNSSPIKDLFEESLSQKSLEKICKTIPHKHKTELCKSYSELGSCRYGQKCRFAHGNHQLKIVPIQNQNYRKRKCKGYWQYNECKYGLRCQFDHQKLDWTDRLILQTQGMLLLQQEQNNQNSRLLKLLK